MLFLGKNQILSCNLNNYKEFLVFRWVFLIIFFLVKLKSLKKLRTLSLKFTFISSTQTFLYNYIDARHNLFPITNIDYDDLNLKRKLGSLDYLYSEYPSKLSSFEKIKKKRQVDNQDHNFYNNFIEKNYYKENKCVNFFRERDYFISLILLKDKRNFYSGGYYYNVVPVYEDIFEGFDDQIYLRFLTYKDKFIALPFIDFRLDFLKFLFYLFKPSKLVDYLEKTSMKK